MKKLNVYRICLDNGQTCTKQFVVTHDEQEAKSRAHGEGEVMMTKLFENYKLDTAIISNVLFEGNINQNDVDVIVDVLSYCGIGW